MATKSKSSKSTLDTMGIFMIIMLILATLVAVSTNDRGDEGFLNTGGTVQTPGAAMTINMQGQQPGAVMKMNNPVKDKKFSLTELFSKTPNLHNINPSKPNPDLGQPLNEIAPPRGAAPVQPQQPAAMGGTSNGRIKQILSEGHWHGIEVVPLNWELATKLKIPLDIKGIMIDEATLAGFWSGFRANDIVQEINGMTVESLEDFQAATRSAMGLTHVHVKVLRNLAPQTLTMTDDGMGLGMGQMETPPQVPKGAVPPHRWRGPCINCHLIGTGADMNPDPGNIILPPPAIAPDAVLPHRWKGECSLCHQIITR